MKMNSSKEFKAILNQLVDILVSYLEKNQQTNTRVTNYYSPEELKSHLELKLPKNGIPLQEIIPIIESYLKYSVKTAHPYFFNLLFSGANLPAILAELVTATSNTTMHTYESAPVATLLELELIKNLNYLIGFEDGEGLMVTGGSNANLIGMLCARNQILPSATTEGINHHHLVAFISDQAHYSYLKGANLLGIGINNVVKINSDIQGAMIPEALEKAVIETIHQGKTPFFVGATAGTTVFGAFDPLIAIEKVTGKYGLWLHVDGAWGAPVLFSQKYKHLLQGSELADSFTWDAHKLMGTPVICSAILLKKKGILIQVCSTGSDDYLFHNDEHESYNLGEISLSCGRKVDAFKLWLSWQYYGSKGYEAQINRLFELANYTIKYLEESTYLELIKKPYFLNICFRYLDQKKRINNLKLNQLNLQIRYKLMIQGDALINYAHDQGKTFMRLILTNPQLTEKEINIFLQHIIDIGKICSQTIN